MSISISNSVVKKLSLKQTTMMIMMTISTRNKKDNNVTILPIISLDLEGLISCNHTTGSMLILIIVKFQDINQTLHQLLWNFLLLLITKPQEYPPLINTCSSSLPYYLKWIRNSQTIFYLINLPMLNGLLFQSRDLLYIKERLTNWGILWIIKKNHLFKSLWFAMIRKIIWNNSNSISSNLL